MGRSNKLLIDSLAQFSHLNLEFGKVPINQVSPHLFKVWTSKFTFFCISSLPYIFHFLCSGFSFLLSCFTIFPGFHWNNLSFQKNPTQSNDSHNYANDNNTHNKNSTNFQQQCALNTYFSKGYQTSYFFHRLFDRVLHRLFCHFLSYFADSQQADPKSFTSLLHPNSSQNKLHKQKHQLLSRCHS